MNRHRQLMVVGTMALVPVLAGGSAGGASGPAAALSHAAVTQAAQPAAPPWLCHPQDYFSPGGPSWGGTDSLGSPEPVARADITEGSDEVFIGCAANLESGLSIGKPGDRFGIAGENLSGLKIKFDGVPLTPDLMSDELVEFDLPPHPDGEWPIELRDAAGRLQGIPGIIYRTPAPVVTAVINLSGGVGAAGKEFLVTGARLFEAAIRIDDLAVPIVRGSNTATALRFVMPDLSGTPAGPGGTRRLALAGYSGVTSTTFAPAAARPRGPVITGLENDDHANLANGFSGASMTVQGWGLTGARVRVDGTAARIVENFDDQLTFVMPEHAAGQVDVVVANRLGSTFTGSSYLVPSKMPVITSASRRGGGDMVFHGGDQIVLRGRNLLPAAPTVDDDSPGVAYPADVFTDSLLIYTLPPHAPAVDVRYQLLNPYGRAVAFVNYDVPVTAPVLTRLSPATGSTAGGEIQVAGRGISPMTVSARADGKVIPAAYVSPTAVKVVLPPHPPGLGKVTVTVGNAQRSSTTTFNYRYAKPSRTTRG